MKIKGQTSLEFFLLFGLSMIMMAVLFGVIMERQASFFESQEREKAAKTAENLAFQVEMALVQGDGYSRTFRLPDRIGGSNYLFKILNGTVYLGWEESFVTVGSLYDNRTIEKNSSTSNVFKVKKNSSGVFLLDE